MGTSSVYGEPREGKIEGEMRPGMLGGKQGKGGEFEGRFEKGDGIKA
jgi:hypothetical protein